MTMGGNPDPDNSPNEKWPETTCPLCGQPTRRLPHHFRHEGCSGT